MFNVHPINPQLAEISKYSVKSKLDYLRTYFEKIENIFQRELEFLYDLCDSEDLKNAGHENDDQYDYRASDASIEIELIYLRMHRYSAILALYSYLESSMNKLCADFEEKKNIPIGINKITNNGISRCNTYLSKLGGVDFAKIKPEWDHLTTLNSIRNCIIHADGVITKDKSIIEKTNGLSFIEKNLIMAENEFVKESIKNTEKVLNYLIECRDALL